jgi:hypothetical protein
LVSIATWDLLSPATPPGKGQNGIPAVILDVEGFAGLTGTLITVLNENVIYLSGYGNL